MKASKLMAKAAKHLPDLPALLRRPRPGTVRPVQAQVLFLETAELHAVMRNRAESEKVFKPAPVDFQGLKKPSESSIERLGLVAIVLVLFERILFVFLRSTFPQNQSSLHKPARPPEKPLKRERRWQQRTSELAWKLFSLYFCKG